MKGQMERKERGPTGGGGGVHFENNLPHEPLSEMGSPSGGGTDGRTESGGEEEEEE